MKLSLSADLFVNGKYSVTYGYKVATFTIIDEFYASLGVNAEVKRIVCGIQTYSSTGALLSSTFGSLVIGLGDMSVGVTSLDPTLLGLLMTQDNMQSCTVELYE